MTFVLEGFAGGVPASSSSAAAPSCLVFPSPPELSSATAMPAAAAAPITLLHNSTGFFFLKVFFACVFTCGGAPATAAFCGATAGAGRAPFCPVGVLPAAVTRAGWGPA